MREIIAVDLFCVPAGHILLGENSDISQTREGQKTFSSSGHPVAILKHFERNYEGPLIEIKAVGCLPFKTTPNHPILIATYTDRNHTKPTHPPNLVNWVDAGNLGTLENTRRVRPCLVFPKLKHIAEVPEFPLKYLGPPPKRYGKVTLKLTPDLAELFGLYIAEGHTNDAVNLTFNSNETELIARAKELVEKTLPYKVGFLQAPQYHTTRLIFGGSALARFFREQFGPKAIRKRIPDWLLYAENNILVRTLLGIWEGDGVHNPKPNSHSNPKGTFRIKTSSKLLALQIQQAFSKFGLFIYLSETRREGHVNLIHGHLSLEHNCYELQINNSDVVSFLQGKITSIARPILSHFAEDESNFYLPLKRLQKSNFSGSVYNVSTGSSDFLVSNLVVHNCGAGGTSQGLILAAQSLGKKVDLTAVNHWKKAVETHAANNPWAKHLCMDVQFVDPRNVVPGGHLDILVASPSCIFYSRAAGGRPHLNQKRSSPWDLLNWLELLDVDSVLIENVPELKNWSPLDKKGYPIASRKGTIYKAWIEAIKTLGYKVEDRILNAADYGAPTSRKRLFILAKKRGVIHWPEPTHNRDAFGKRKWRAAREIIDWSIKGQSIFTRKKPLSPNTMRRIIAGLKRFGSQELQPFIVLMEHGGGLKDIEEPLPTITTAKGGSMALVDPFILSQASGGAPRSVEDPMPTIPTGGAHSLTEAFIVQYHGITKGEKEGARVLSLEKPIATIDTSNRYAVAQPFILPVEGFFRQNAPKVVDEPLGTITQRGGGSLVESCLIQYNGASQPQSIDEPLPTISTKSRFGLVQPQINGRLLDIRFRMLQPQELAGAMGFPPDYKFAGTKSDIIRMVGNAVQVDVAKALCSSLLGGT